MEVYTAPLVEEIGTVVALTLGSGGNDSDGCSAGKYQNDDE